MKVFIGASMVKTVENITKAGQKNIVVSCNTTDPWPKPPTQKIFWHFYGKTSHMVNFRWFFCRKVFFQAFTIFFFFFTSVFLVNVPGYSLSVLYKVCHTCILEIWHVKKFCKEIFFPTDRPQKFLECYMKRQYFLVPKYGECCPSKCARIFFVCTL